MALFQFTALDNTGTEKRGTIEAVTQQDAVTAIQHYGLQPTNVFAVNQPQAHSWAPAAPPYTPAPASGGGNFSLYLSLLALLISLGVAGVVGWQWYKKPASAKEQENPLGKGLKAYNFSTPKDAYLSQLQIEVDKDILARLELAKVKDGPQLQEQIDTTQVRKEETWKGITILFIEFQNKGVKKYFVQGFEKHEPSGMWLPKYLNGFEVRKENPELENRIESWLKNGDQPLGKEKKE
jgi:hypothetical protein